MCDFSFHFKHWKPKGIRGFTECCCYCRCSIATQVDGSNATPFACTVACALNKMTCSLWEVKELGIDELSPPPPSPLLFLSSSFFNSPHLFYLPSLSPLACRCMTGRFLLIIISRRAPPCDSINCSRCCDLSAHRQNRSFLSPSTCFRCYATHAVATLSYAS